MSLLSLDLGDKRVGVAISRSGIIAEPLVTLNFDKNFFGELKNICQKEEVKKIIVGLPKSLSGEESEQEKKIRSIAKKIQGLGCQVEFMDESYTTKMAEERRAKDVDQEAAVIILQDYLDRRGN